MLIEQIHVSLFPFPARRVLLSISPVHLCLLHSSVSRLAPWLYLPFPSLLPRKSTCRALSSPLDSKEESSRGRLDHTLAFLPIPQSAADGVLPPNPASRPLAPASFLVDFPHRVQPPKSPGGEVRTPLIPVGLLQNHALLLFVTLPTMKFPGRATVLLTGHMVSFFFFSSFPSPYTTKVSKEISQRSGLPQFSNVLL